MFIDCAADMKSVPGMNLPKIGSGSANAIRNNCYAKNWYLYDLWGRYLENQQHHQQRETLNHTIDSVSDAAIHAATTSLHHNNPVAGTKYCMLEGITSEDRFNLHDCHGDRRFDPLSGEFFFYPETGKTSSVTNKAGRVHTVPVFSSECRLQGNLLLHSKDFDLVKKGIQPHWEKLTKKAVQMMDAVKSSGTEIDTSGVSTHLFPIVEEPSKYQVCNETWSRMLHVDAKKEGWLPPQWRKIVTDFYSEIGLTPP